MRRVPAPPSGERTRKPSSVTSAQTILWIQVASVLLVICFALSLGDRLHSPDGSVGIAVVALLVTAGVNTGCATGLMPASRSARLWCTWAVGR